MVLLGAATRLIAKSFASVDGMTYIISDHPFLLSETVAGEKIAGGG